ncbi:hypothetical protein [Corynebacterium sp. TAE3-ERU16]|uniref:hypothetical protein n=1 Tax=Corynebacterium sp. TAE3-ERU16 TaxID=2849493 RepID=UPI001C441F95|nr:hypothetical protein [Corynebacterium sp. TAE3-ERU16]MBV7293205.1 hypothetical protein [Corynebacterium sp. TAE3-ERU16]
MGALDRIKQADEQQKTTELLEALISQRDADRQQIERLTKAVADLTGYVKVMDEEQTIRLDRLSTSPRLELPSTLPLDAETKRRLTEIEKTLSAVAQQLSSSEVVKLPGGSSVTRADLAAYSMTTKISEELKMTASASADLAEAVRKRGHVRIDTDRLTEHAVKVLDDRLAKAVEVPVQRVEKTVEGLEERVVRLGTEKLAEVTDRAREVVSTVGRAERRVERLSAKVTWATVGRMCLALLPFTVAFIMLTGMVGGITQMLGLGPLLGWAWDSFADASAWWAKALIALAALGGCALFGWLLWWLGKKLYESYRGW